MQKNIKIITTLTFFLMLLLSSFFNSVFTPQKAASRAEEIKGFGVHAIETRKFWNILMQFSQRSSSNIFSNCVSYHNLAEISEKRTKNDSTKALKIDFDKISWIFPSSLIFKWARSIMV